MRGFIWGACVVLFGGACMVFSVFRIQSDTVNERAVRILLECILVKPIFAKKLLQLGDFALQQQ